MLISLIRATGDPALREKALIRCAALWLQQWARPISHAVRALHPKEPMYTFWDYMRNRWERDGGLRLDHILLSSALTERLQSAGVDRHIRGLEDASDHAPVWVELRGASHQPSSENLVVDNATATAVTASSKAKKSARQTG